LPATWSRHRAPRACVPGGMCCSATPAVSSKLASASAGPTGRWPGVWACRERKNCPSGKLPASLCAACTTKVVLPIPAIPSITHISGGPPSAARPVSIPSSRASSGSRPVKPPTSRGRLRVAAAADPPAAPSRLAASTSAAITRPRAAATNSTRTSAGRLSASASSTAVSLRAVRLIPRSRSLTDRGLMPAASASSSCVSRASVRNCRSSPPKFSAGLTTASIVPHKAAVAMLCVL
jgi:hypothetical protein